MHDACCGDDLVRRVSPEVESDGGSDNFQIDGPDMQLRLDASEIPVAEVHARSAELSEFGGLRQHDGRYRPPVVRQQLPFRRTKGSTDGEDQDMGVKIQHRHP